MYCISQYCRIINFFQVRIIYGNPYFDIKDNLFVLLKCRADKHMPTYAKKIVDSYNQNGQIEKMLSNK